jgi:hypothetical protein
VLSSLRINGLPATKPARKRFGVVLKRRKLAHMGSNGTAHLWHTSLGVMECRALSVAMNTAQLRT